MCGRYVNVASSDDLVDEFDVEEVDDEPLPPSWNVAPTDPVRVVLLRPTRADASGRATRQLRTVRWGLVPTWSKDASGGARMINARSETVASKPAFKTAAAKRRCLVPALGYYEWSGTGRGKQAHFLHESDDRLLAMAGLYEFWRDPARGDDDPDRWLVTCTIITRQATDELGQIHDRCPVLVPAQLRQAWLDCSDGDANTAAHLLQEMPPPVLHPDAVSPAVGNVRNNGPELIVPIDRDAP